LRLEPTSETPSAPLGQGTEPAADVVVVGAGPAGLTAATYLGRFLRKVVVLDGGPPRASWIPTSHNTPAFPDGVSGQALLARMREQALRYGARIVPGRATGLTPRPAGFIVAADGLTVGARLVLLACGIADEKPDLAGLDDAIRQGLVRMCPICDGYEARGQRIAVLGDGDLALREARYLRTFSAHVTVLMLGAGAHPPPDLAVRAVDPADIALLADAVQVRTGGGAETFDCLYLALGCDPAGSLARQWGAAHDEEGALIVDAHQQTSIRGLYAAGDLVRGLNQIAVATGEAAIAACAMHNVLRAGD
jgi:thioredoxin reductase (NADPH)